MPPAQQQASAELAPDSEAGRAILEARQALERHQLDKAESAVRLALTVAPDHWEGHHLRGILLARAKRWEEAEASFRKAHQLNPTHPGPLTNLGNLYTERALYQEAIAYYQRALDLDPNYANAHHNLAVAYRRIGRIEQSIRHLKKAQKLEVLSQPASRSPASPIPNYRGRFLWWLLLGAALALGAGIGLS